MLDIAKKGDGFITYNHKFTNNDEFSVKTAYIKGFDNWQWLIGKGFYQDDIQQLLLEKEKQLDEEYGKKIFNVFVIVFILTIGLMIISIYISKILEKKFEKYNKTLFLYKYYKIKPDFISLDYKLLESSIYDFCTNKYIWPIENNEVNLPFVIEKENPNFKKIKKILLEIYKLNSKK